jgi:hypothetical protein
MTEEPQESQSAESLSLYGKHRFGLMIILAILIAFGLVLVSMALYHSSGAAQLDLSRPGYSDIRDQVDKSDGFQDYPSIGPVSASVVTDFKLLFSEKVKKIESVDTFGGDPLSPNALGVTVRTTL